MIMETVVAAVLAGHATCSDYFPMQNRLNPQDLSDRGRCMIHTVFEEDTSGVMEFQAWVKINGKIYSVPLATIQNQGSSKSALEFFKQQVTQQVVGDVLEEIAVEAETIEVRLETLEAVAETVNSAELNAEIVQLRAQLAIKELEIARLNVDAAMTAEAHAMAVTELNEAHAVAVSAAVSAVSASAGDVVWNEGEATVVVTLSNDITLDVTIDASHLTDGLFTQEQLTAAEQEATRLAVETVERTVAALLRGEHTDTTTLSHIARRIRDLRAAEAAEAAAWAELPDHYSESFTGTLAQAINDFMQSSSYRNDQYNAIRDALRTAGVRSDGGTASVAQMVGYLIADKAAAEADLEEIKTELMIDGEINPEAVIEAIGNLEQAAIDTITYTVGTGDDAVIYTGQMAVTKAYEAGEAAGIASISFTFDGVTTTGRNAIGAAYSAGIATQQEQVSSDKFAAINALERMQRDETQMTNQHWTLDRYDSTALQGAARDAYMLRTIIQFDAVMDNTGSLTLGAYTSVFPELDAEHISFIRTAIEDAFDAGYEEGYADGYNDGFRDGVDSVRGNEALEREADPADHLS